MNGGPPGRVAGPPWLIDSTVPHPARVYDYLVGGDAHFEVDRRMAERVFDGVYPDGVRTARQDVRANRGFLGRAVRYLAVEAGIRQFLDIGTGVPTEDGNSVHEVAGQAARDNRIVYVDCDPVVLASAHNLPAGATRFVHGDVRDIEHLLAEAAETLDLTEPVAVLALGVLHFIGHEDDPYGLVRELLRPLVPGSHLAISHLANDINTAAMAEVARRTDQKPMSEPSVLRDRAAMTRFFDGLELVEPGIVRVDEWRPTEQPPAPTRGGWQTPIWCGVGRKP